MAEVGEASVTREDLLAGGWERVQWYSPRGSEERWRNPEVRDGHMHRLNEAVWAEEIRRKMKPRVRVNQESTVRERDAILAGLKTTFSHEDLRYIATGLERYLSPELSFEECVSRKVSSVVPSPRRAPGMSG